MTNFMQMLGQVKEMQAKIQEIQQKAAHLQATGESGAGLVKATVNGNKKLLRLEIDPSIIQIEEQAMLQDLIVAAVNMAIQSIENKTKDMVQSHTAGMLGNLPLDLVL
jgi:DNA-binding YbaB/EbfC family protein